MKVFERNIWCVLGLPFDAYDLNGAVAFIRQSIRTSDKCFLSTPNLNFIIGAQNDDGFYNSVVDSHLSIADGMPIVWVAKFLGIPLTERVAGSSLFDELVVDREGSDQPIKVFFFGGEEGVAERAHMKLNELNSNVTSCGFYGPGFVSVERMSSSEIIENINAQEPDFVLVALGAKKGQQWIQKNLEILNCSVVSHLGAVINFTAGGVARAPSLWQRYGFEWLWRIKQEPGLLKRYVGDGLSFSQLFLMRVIPLAICNKIFKLFLLEDNKFSAIKNINTLSLEGDLTVDNSELIQSNFSMLLDETANDDIIIDLRAVTFMDGNFIALLLILQRELNVKNRQLRLVRMPFRIKIILYLNCVNKRFVYG